MSEKQDDRLFDENISRLLNRSLETPKMSRETEATMLGELKKHQAELGSKTPAKATDPAATSATRSQFAAVVAAIVVVAALVFLAVLVGRQPVSDSPPEERPLASAGFSTDAGGPERMLLEDGTVLIAQAGTKFTVEDRRTIRLVQGAVYLIVARAKGPFVVMTRQGEASATGTRFVVSAGEKTTAAVAQGRVELTNKSGRVQLRAGQQGVLQKGKPPTRGPAPRMSYLVNWAQDALAQDELLVEKSVAQSGLIALDPWGQESRLTLRKYNVDVHIEDGIARTTIDQTFFNHYPWNTEGTFYFPLPPDASVSRLAMYVNGDLNEGGMVDRFEGQMIYNDIVLQRRDPALLEMMEGNVFKMRIFPLEGRQEKRVFLSYTQDLAELYGTMRFWFPMDHTHSVAKELSIRVRVKGAAGSYQPQSSTHKLASRIDGDDLVLEYSANNTKPDQDLLLHLVPDETANRQSVATCDKDGHRYVFGRLAPELTGRIEPKPRQWIVLNDISASRTAIEAKAQRYIVERLAQEADDDDRLAVIDLNTRARLVQPEIAGVKDFVSVSQVRGGRFAAEPQLSPLLPWVQRPRIGGTNIEAGLRAVAELVKQNKIANPHILYLGDGVATDGADEVVSLVRLLPKGATFVGVGVGKKVDARFLQAAADATGGMYTTINPDEDIDWRVFDMIAALNTPRLTGIDVALLDAQGEPVEAVAYPSARAISAGETLFVVARTENKLPSSITVTGRLGEKSVKRVLSLGAARNDAEYIPRRWAKRHIDELLKSGPEHKEEIVALSKQYYVVTPHTSLIVLEDDAMYEKYKVERGRKDHWALYPAPKKIEVVKEPVDWNRWYGWGVRPGVDENSEVKEKPQSVQEIVDSVQFRINAPFYYSPPRRDDHGRFAMYQLVDSETDPTRLLVYAFAQARNPTHATRTGPAESTDDGNDDGKEDGASARGVEGLERQLAQREAKLRLISELVSSEFDIRVLVTDRQEMFSVVPKLNAKQLGQNYGLSMIPMTVTQLRPRVSSKPQPLSALVINGPFPNTPIISSGGIRIDPMPLAIMLEDNKWLRRRLETQLSHVGTPELGASWAYGGDISSGAVRPDLRRSLRLAVGRRMALINKDVNDYNRRYGHWNGRWNDWTVSDSIDLRKSASARLNSGFEGIVSDVERLEERIMIDMPAKPRLPGNSFFYLPHDSGRGWDRPAVAAAWVGVYDQTLKTQPGTCSILAADFLATRRDALLAKDRTPEDEKELESFQRALGGASAAAARLEQSGVFWSSEGWNYRPRPWTFQPPTVQAYRNYNWSFDLTRYAPGLYSSTFDLLDEVTSRHGTKPRGTVGKDAAQRIEKARQAIRPVRIRYGDKGPALLAASADRFAVTRSTEMSLVERVVCDGRHVLHLYDELGLAARRKATPLRRASLRQSAPHFVPPADWLALRFDVALEETTGDSFLLKLKPVGQTISNEEEEAEEKEEANGSYITLRIGNDGLIRQKALFVGRTAHLKLDFAYDDDAITVRWLDKDAKELAKVEYRAQPVNAGDDRFATDLDRYVVIDMPLRKPSYYAQQLDELNADDVAKKIELQRHHALASIQQLHWRRWGQANNEARKSLVTALDLMKQQDRKPLLGDLTLLGSAGVYDLGELREIYSDIPPTHPVPRYFLLRRNGWHKSDELRDDVMSGLIRHLSAYHAAEVKQNDTENLQRFAKEFSDSPLLLAAVSQVARREGKPESWFLLYDHPTWRGLAMMMSAGELKTPEQRQRFAAAFKKLYDESAEAGFDVPITSQIAAQLKGLDPGKVWQSIVADKFERVKKLERAAPLLHFAEQATSWGETKLADEAFELARQRLAGNDTLLARFALAQAYWASGRTKDALPLHDEILAELDKRKVDASPALLASTARLAQQSGAHQRAIELEERTLAIEHEHLPELINLNAFRQRYQWLWKQYQSKVAECVAANDDELAAEWLARAEVAWQRWHDVDRGNVTMVQQMATLQMSAGRQDEAWMYLSTLIDQKPRDAQSYYAVGGWYQGRNELDAAQRYFARAYEWDTANPQWLFERAQVLDKMGRTDESREVYQQIIDGQWAPGLQRYVDRAKQALK